MPILAARHFEHNSINYKINLLAYLSFEIQLNTIDAEFSHVDVPLVRLVLRTGTWYLQCHSLSVFLFRNSVLPQPRLEILLELARTGVPHARLD